MTTTLLPGGLVPVGDTPLFADAERLALVGFLAGYRDLTRRAYTVDLRLFTAWCTNHDLALFGVRRVDIECYARELETGGRARSTVARRLCTLAGFYRYAEQEGLIERSPAVHVRRPRLDQEDRPGTPAPLEGALRAGHLPDGAVRRPRRRAGRVPVHRLRFGEGPPTTTWVVHLPVAYPRLAVGKPSWDTGDIVAPVTSGASARDVEGVIAQRRAGLTGDDLQPDTADDGFGRALLTPHVRHLTLAHQLVGWQIEHRDLILARQR